jgi:hypothetical protein
MHMIDMASHWVTKTGHKMKNQLRLLHQFGNRFGVDSRWLYSPPPYPPHGPAIFLCWSIEDYTLKTSGRQGRNFVGYNGTRGLHSAAYDTDIWSAGLQTGLVLHCDTERILNGNPDSTHGASSHVVTQLTLAGLKHRLGTETTPAQAMLGRHVYWNVSHRIHLICAVDTSRNTKLDLLHANCAEGLTWLGWLCGGKSFSLRWWDITIIKPADSVRAGLPANTGCIQVRLQESTKSDQTKQADIVIAFKSSSSLSLGLYLHALRSSLWCPGRLRQLHLPSP